MKLGNISKVGMDNLMCAVRLLKVSPEELIQYLLENPHISIEEAKCYGIKQQGVNKKQ